MMAQRWRKRKRRNTQVKMQMKLLKYSQHNDILNNVVAVKP
jgi:hypothetical protein